MQEQLYRLILEGTVQEGLNRKTVVGRLSSVFKQDEAIVEKLLSGKPRVVKKDLDLATARKYQHIIEQAGAVVRVEPSAGEAGALLSPKEPSTREAPEIQCPKCGYQPCNEYDVLLIRGDCPRCGLLVRKAEDVSTEGEESLTEEDASFSEDDAENAFPKQVPASLKRRALASIYTFGCFVLVYWCMVLLFVLVFFPVELVLIQIFRWLPETALTNFPMVFTAMSIFVVSFFAPLTNQGRSWGQTKLEVGLLFRREVETGGLILSLTFRLGAIVLLTYGPGLIVLHAAELSGFAAVLPDSRITMVVMAAVAWVTSWLVVIAAPDKRGLLDRAAGTIQVEETFLPRDAVNTALTPLMSAVAFFVVIGVLIPMIFKYFAR
jgi:hypothetical protein